jgi:phosphatidate cytidylyltransferase
MVRQPILVNRSAKVPGGVSELTKRILSAIVLAPLVLAAIYFGPPYSDILILVAGVLMAWEWAVITGSKDFDLPMAAQTLTMLGALGCATFGFYQIGLIVLLVGAIAAFLAAYQPRENGGPARAKWCAFGVLYLGLACLSFQWVRAYSLNLILILLVAVWITDIGAYFVGRSLGGPKLAPRISPKKTWSGFIGGVTLAALAVASMPFILDFGAAEGHKKALIFLVSGGVLAAVSQGGDLLESHLKRRHGVKDSSRLIPGHGGILDRADGLMAAALVMGAYLLVESGELGNAG